MLTVHLHFFKKSIGTEIFLFFCENLGFGGHGFFACLSKCWCLELWMLFFVVLKMLVKGVMDFGTLAKMLVF